MGPARFHCATLLHTTSRLKVVLVFARIALGNPVDDFRDCSRNSRVHDQLVNEYLCESIPKFVYPIYRKCAKIERILNAELARRPW